MRRLLKSFTVFSVIAMLLFSFCISVGAVEETHNSQDGLVASITTKKDGYQSNEDIDLTFKVTNTNDFTVENVSLEAIIPDGLTLKRGDNTSINTVSLASGESLELTLTVVKESSVIVVPIETTNPNTEQPTETKPLSTENTTTVQTESVQATTTKANSVVSTASDSNNTNGSDNSSIKTGNNTNYILIGLICLISLAVAVLAFRFRNKAVKYLSLALCVCISVSSIAVVGVTNTMAQETNQEMSFSVSKSITVDNKTYIIQNIVNYELSELELCSDINYVFTNENEKYYVTFYCKSNTTAFSKLKLYCTDNNTIICDLLDNGDSNNGDLKSSDGIYSAKVQISSSSETTYTYKALAETNKEQISSNSVKISVINDYSEEDYKKIEKVDSSISVLLESNEYKKLDLEERIEMVKKLLYTLSLNGTSDCPCSLIKFNSICYEESTHTFGFQYFNGDLGGVTIEEEIPEFKTDDGTIIKSMVGTSLNTMQSVSKDVKTNNQNKCVIMYDWFDNIEQTEQYYRDYEESWSKKGLNTTTFIHPTLDDYANKLSNKELIIFATHGGQYPIYTNFLSKNTYSAICTLEKETKETNEKYKYDINQHHIVKANGTYWILPSFFHTYYGSSGLKNSIILMDNCYGFGSDKLDDYTFSFELTNCGAQSVIGFHNSVNIFWTYDYDEDGTIDDYKKGYGPSFIENVVNSLLSGNNVKYSYENALNVIGSTEYEYCKNNSYPLSEKSKNVYPRLAGDSDFKLPSIINVGKGSISANIISSNNTPLSKVRVDAYLKEEADLEYFGNTYTDDNGNFTMELQSGSYELRFNKDGYKTATTTVKISKDVMTVLKDPIVMETNVDWKQLYTDYINKTNSAYDYSLIYLNNDDIPELCLTGKYTMAGDILCWINNGSVQEETALGNYGTSYIEKEGLLLNTGGRQGTYFDKVFSFNGKNLELKIDGKSQEVLDDNSTYDFIYYINGDKVTKAEYNNKIDSIFDKSKSIKVSNKTYSKEEIIEIIKNM